MPPQLQIALLRPLPQEDQINTVSCPPFTARIPPVSDLPIPPGGHVHENLYGRRGGHVHGERHGPEVQTLQESLQACFGIALHWRCSAVALPLACPAMTVIAGCRFPQKVISAAMPALQASMPAMPALRAQSPFHLARFAEEGSRRP